MRVVCVSVENTVCLVHVCSWRSVEIQSAWCMHAIGLASGYSLPGACDVIGVSVGIQSCLVHSCLWVIVGIQSCLVYACHQLIFGIQSAWCKRVVGFASGYSLPGVCMSLSLASGYSLPGACVSVGLVHRDTVCLVHACRWRSVGIQSAWCMRVVGVA